MCSETNTKLIITFIYTYLIIQVLLFTLHFYLVSHHNLILSLIATLPMSLFIPSVYLIFQKYVCSEDFEDIDENEI